MPEINEAFESWFEERKYIAVSIKHSTRDSFMYWGILTKDNEPRCYSGYTYEFDKCEIYSRYVIADYKKCLCPSCSYKLKIGAIPPYRRKTQEVKKNDD